MTIADSTTSVDVRCRDILQMWLVWNESSQQITERLFAERENPEKLQERLDHLDRLRLEAVSASQQHLAKES
jgi:hypothetical protein